MAKYLLNFKPTELFTYYLKSKNVPDRELVRVIDDGCEFKAFLTVSISIGSSISSLSEEIKSHPKLRIRIAAIRAQADLLYKAATLKTSFLAKTPEASPVIGAYINTAETKS